MTKLDGGDWDLLSAYHDGELDRGAVIALERRLRGEPELAEALAEIRAMSAALKPLRPPIVLTPRRRIYWPALAASIAALAIGAGIYLSTRPAPPGTTTEWHQAFLDRAYVGGAATTPGAAGFGIGNEPDLTAANLTLVDMAEGRNGDRYFHYMGVNGCRLTLGAHRGARPAPEPVDGALSHSWSVGDIRYNLLSNGMDPGKFASISAYLETLTRTGSDEARTVVAMREATQAALPCA